MKLSIIIPYYNTPEETAKLLKALDAQMPDETIGEVEVLLIDDGSIPVFDKYYEWLNVIWTPHKGQSAARNLGIESTTGDYIQFIDSDDIIPLYFIERILEKISEEPDLIEYSWESFEDKRSRFRIPENGRCLNISACTRCFKRSYIGNVRFNEQKDATEDEDFARHLGLHADSKVKVSTIQHPMYYYRKHSGGVEDSFKKGLKKTKKVVYFYHEVTEDRTDILEQIREDDKTNQVWLMTYSNMIPELEKYCQVLRPFNTWAHELKGEPFNRVVLIPKQEAGSERLSEKENEVHPSECGI
jgi:glycosyltransferase involved in cell wall biosynthesis